MSGPLVSIITPSFNQAAWLEQCIQSVLNQTYKNIEYIIIDGGSTDHSVEIIQKYSSQLKYWQSKPDGGQSNAINIGFKHASGKIIAYLNADDLYEPEAVETIVRTYEVNDEYAIYYGKCKTIDKNGILLHESKGEQLRFDYLLKQGMLPHMYQPACFFNTRYINRGFFVDEQYQFAFDYELILHLAQQYTTIFLNRDIASYRVHNESKSHNYQVQAYKEKITIQETYSKANFLMWKWRRFKLAIAEQTGKLTSGKAAL